MVASQFNVWHFYKNGYFKNDYPGWEHRMQIQSVTPGGLKSRVRVAIEETTMLIDTYEKKHSAKKSAVKKLKYLIAVFTALSSASAIEPVRAKFSSSSLADFLLFVWPSAKSAPGLSNVLPFLHSVTFGIIVAICAVLMAAWPLLGNLTEEIDKLGSRVSQYTQYRWFFQRMQEYVGKPDANETDYREALTSYYDHYTSMRDQNGDNPISVPKLK